MCWGIREIVKMDTGESSFWEMKEFFFFSRYPGLNVFFMWLSWTI